jgi:hypothetical protein
MVFLLLRIYILPPTPEENAIILVQPEGLVLEVQNETLNGDVDDFYPGQLGTYVKQSFYVTPINKELPRWFVVYGEDLDYLWERYWSYRNSKGVLVKENGCVLYLDRVNATT